MSKSQNTFRGMNYTGTKVPGFWEQPTRNIRDISNAVVVSLFTTASP